jgi:hypothetical protein
MVKSVAASVRVRVVHASGRGEAAWACEVKGFSLFVLVSVRFLLVAPPSHAFPFPFWVTIARI